MTLNEKISQVMGWDYEEREYVWGEKFIWMGYGPSDNRVSLTNPNFCTMPLAKLLQQKMVDDGFAIRIKYNFEAYVFLGKTMACMGKICATEPAAIVSLFCKVYGLEV